MSDAKYDPLLESLVKFQQWNAAGGPDLAAKLTAAVAEVERLTRLLDTANSLLAEHVRLLNAAYGRLEKTGKDPAP